MHNEDSGERDGFFKTFHNKVLKEISTDEIQFVFEGITPSEKVKRVRSLKCAKDLKFELAVKGKSRSEAEKSRNEGNKFFQKGEHEKALRFYTLSVIISPPYDHNTGDTTLSLALANRSAALFHLKKYTLAIADVDEALSSGYPENLQHKIYDRRARCKLELEDGVGSIKDFEKTLQLLEKLQQDNKVQKQIDDVKKLLGKRQSQPGKGKKHRQSEKALPLFISGSNPKFPCASKSVEIRSSPEQGRYAVATRDIAVGEIILVEKPFTSVQQPHKYATHCHHCFKVLQAPVPCPKCSRISFCSPECRNSACESYHKIECKLIDPLWFSGISITCYLALRMTARKPPQFFQIKENPELEAVESLVTHSERRSAKDYFNNCIMAMFLLECLIQAGYFDQHKDDRADLVDLIGGKLLTYLELLQFNTHEVSELVLQKPGDYKTANTVYLGAAIYPTLALLNHSCEPGIVRYHVGDTVVARVIKPVLKGEMIEENYGPIFSQMPKPERLSTLKERYWFDCACQPCVENWPLFEELATVPWKFRCGKCHKGNPVQFDSLDPVITCSKCKATINIMKGLKVLQETEGTYTKGTELLLKAEIAEAQKCFEDLLAKLVGVLTPPFNDHLTCEESLRRCYLAAGNVNRK